MEDEELVELMRLYVRKGVRDWRTHYPTHARRDTECTLKLRIAQNDHDAVAVLDGNRKRTGAEFIPMPRLDAPKIEWAFFAPRRKTADPAAGWVFDLLLLLEQGRHIGFRLESADGYEDARHGFSHVQLSWRFRHRQVEPEAALKWLPDSYPAFPLPGNESTDRFLMLLVALHGFPTGTGELLREMDPGRPAWGKRFADRASRLLGGRGNSGAAA